MLTVRPGLRSSDSDEQASAWKVLEALDARVDVTREVSEEIARLRERSGAAAAMPESDDKPVRPEAPVRPEKAGDGAPAGWMRHFDKDLLVGIGAAAAVGIGLTLVTRWATALVVKAVYWDDLPAWASPVKEALYDTDDTVVVALGVLTLGLMVYAGMRHAPAAVAWTARPLPWA